MEFKRTKRAHKSLGEKNFGVPLLKSRTRFGSRMDMGRGTIKHVLGGLSRFYGGGDEESRACHGPPPVPRTPHRHIESSEGGWRRAATRVDRSAGHITAHKLKVAGHAAASDEGPNSHKWYHTRPGVLDKPSPTRIISHTAAA